MNRTSLERAFRNQSACSCPEPLDYAKAELEGVELQPAPCILHTAQGRKAQAEAELLESRLEAMRYAAAYNKAAADELPGRPEPELDPGDLEGRLRRLVGAPPAPPPAPTRSTDKET